MQKIVTEAMEVLDTLTNIELLDLVEIASSELYKRAKAVNKTPSLSVEAEKLVEKLIDSTIDEVPVDKSVLTATYDPHSVRKPDYVDFVVNKEKRTVVALVKIDLGGEISTWARGKAKCTPGDMFDENIGKVIALHRAFGLKVPEKFVK